MPRYTTTLLGSRTVAEGTMAFRFAKPAGFDFAAGQAINLTLPDPPETDDKGNTRTFSLVSAPYEPELMIATRMRDSAFKRVLKTLPAGSPVEIEGPSGEFTLDPGDSPAAVFLAGGIGVTPFVSMLRQAAHEKNPRELWLFYSNRRPEDAAFLEELAAIGARHPHHHFVGTMVEMEKSARAWSGERGVIDRAMLARHLPDLSACVYYLAGPPGMVSAMQDLLLEAGVEERAIRTDEFYGY